MLNVFGTPTNAFDVVRLTDQINQISYRPGLVSSMGLFSPTPVNVLTVALEQRGDMLVWVPPSARGGPGTTFDKQKRNMRAITIPHHQLNDAVMADEVQGVRKLGTEDQLEVVQDKVIERQTIMVDSFAITEEASMLGAVKGIVTYADASTLDLFDLMSVSQETTIDFDLDNATPVDGVLRELCMGIYRQMTGILGGVSFDGITAICGDNFFDALIKHPEVRETYKGYIEAITLRSGYLDTGKNQKAHGRFTWGDIDFVNYRGNSMFGVDTDTCHMFPTGVPNLFRSFYGPADYNETVNTLGERSYSKMWEMPNGKGYELESQTNPLYICQRPRALLKGSKT